MAPFELKTEIVLDSIDGKTITRYFPGDEIHGKVYFTCNQSYKVRGIRLAWSGQIIVQPIQSNRDTRTYFDECWKFSSIIKQDKKSNIYKTHMIAANINARESLLELQKNKKVGLAFKVLVPNDQPLPSCTEAGALPNKIMYLLKAYIDEDGKQQSCTQLHVPVYEYIFSRTPEMMQPTRAEQVFVVSNERAEFTSAMRMTLPFLGAQPGTELPLSITIWNNMAFSRKQGISISLLRFTEVLANGRTFASQGEKVHRIVHDLNITMDDPEQNQKVQTLRIKFPVPKGITPTISFDSSQLLSINYLVRVQAFAQEGVYITAQGTRSQFMMLDLPILVCTKSTPPGDTAGLSSPTLSFTRANQSSLFRSLSNGSSSTTTSDKISSFSTLRLYDQVEEQPHQVSPVVVMTPKSVHDDTRTVSSLHLHTDNSLLGLATSLSRQNSSGSHGNTSVGSVGNTSNGMAGSTRSLGNGQVERNPSNQEEVIKTKDDVMIKGGGRVFQMFDDDDSDDDEQVEQVQVSLQKEHLIDNRVKPEHLLEKPHLKEDFVYKPNVIDSDSHDETEDESDLLGALARHEVFINMA